MPILDIDRKCTACNRPGTLVHAKRENNRGIDKDSVLLCDSCDPMDFNESYNHVHEYDPEIDDYYLGFTSIPPIAWDHQMVDYVCYECNQVIEAWQESMRIRVYS